MLLRFTSRLIKWWMPALETRTPEEQKTVEIEAAATLLYIPVALIGVMLLIAATDGAVITANAPMLLGIIAIIALSRRFEFNVWFDLGHDKRGEFSESMDSVIVFSAVFFYGPSALWLFFIPMLLGTPSSWKRARSPRHKLSILRTLFSSIIGSTAAQLLGLSVYQALGGTFPIADLSLVSILRGFVALFIQYLIMVLLVLPVFGVMYWRVWRHDTVPMSVELLFMRFLFTALSLPLAIAPFGILGAGIHVMAGVSAYLFFLGGMIIVGALAYHLSRSVQSSQQRYGEIAAMEALGRALLGAPADGSKLRDVLQEHVLNMFPLHQIEIKLFPDTMLMQHDRDRESIPNVIWTFAQGLTKALAFPVNKALPWGGMTVHESFLIAPIIKDDVTIGAVILVRSWDAESIADLLPAAQSLAAQIAAAVRNAEMYERTLANQRLEHELALAGSIQSTFLPISTPRIKGWELAAMLDPARQTSGDFYDFIHFDSGEIGMIVADVADKGVGAALYMALSRTLIRTYAYECGYDPAEALAAANRRILFDSSADLFVTVFYGILDPRTGVLTYCNAGHNPAYLFSPDGSFRKLTRTGIPLGMFEDARFRSESVTINPGDVLLLYTDGVTDASGLAGMFGEARMLDTLRDNRNKPAHEIQRVLTERLRDFSGSTPQFDDITLMVVTRTLEQVSELAAD